MSEVIESNRWIMRIEPNASLDQADALLLCFILFYDIFQEPNLLINAYLFSLFVPLDPGSWNQDPGACIQDPGSEIQEHGSGMLVARSRIQDPGSGILYP